MGPITTINYAVAHLQCAATSSTKASVDKWLLPCYCRMSDAVSLSLPYSVGPAADTIRHRSPSAQRVHTDRTAPRQPFQTRRSGSCDPCIRRPTSTTIHARFVDLLQQFIYSVPYSYFKISITVVTHHLFRG